MYPETEKRLHDLCPTVSTHIVSGTNQSYDGVIETLLNAIDGSPFCDLDYPDIMKEEDLYLQQIGLNCELIEKSST